MTNDISTHVGVLAYLLAQYPQYDMPKESKRAWLSELQDVDPDLLFRAARYHVNTSHWFPGVSNMREALAQLQYYGRVPPAYEAWSEVVAVLMAEPVMWQRHCAEGYRLGVLARDVRDAKYWDHVHNYDQHVKHCDAGCTKTHENLQFTNKLAERIARMLNIKEINPEREVSDRAQFIRAYDQAVQAQKQQATLPMLEVTHGKE